jgi:glycosyltransferase involved in cell wall biosynthesis
LGKPVIVHLHDYIPSCPLATLYDVSKGEICESGSGCSMRCIYSFEKLKGNSFVWTMESVLLNSTVGRYIGRLVDFADVVICVSKLQREKVGANNRALLNKSVVVYNPLPEVSFSPVQGESYGYFGGMSYIKGFLTLFDATRLARREFLIKPKIHVTNFPRKPLLQKSLSDLGFVVHEKVERVMFERIYSDVSTTIVPSLWHEPWPYVVIEALIKGRYLIGSRVGGIPEQVEDCKGVTLCEPGDKRQLAAAMSMVKGLSRETIVDLGANNREMFLRRFNNETSMKNMIKLCERVA